MPPTRSTTAMPAGSTTFSRFYGENAELPTHYDLVVNTDRLSSEEAVELVALAARH